MARIDWDAVAHHYPAARELSLEGMQGWRSATAPYLGGVDGPILDLGCGTGLFIGAFHTWFDAHVLGIDPSRAMLGQARQRVGGPLLRATGERLPLAPASVSAAWLSTVIHHLPDLDTAAQELRRVVAPGGPVVIRSAFPGRLQRLTSVRFFPEVANVIATFPSVGQARRAFEAAGFRFEEIRPVEQVSAPNLAAHRDRARLRADTTLRLISDAAFSAGMARLDAAITRGEGAEPVVDALDLLTFV